VKLIDANAVIYALGVPHPYRDLCQRILRALDSDDQDYVMDTEVLQEVLHVFDRRGQRLKGIQKVTDLLIALKEVIPVGASEIAITLRVLGEHPRLSPRDAIHAAVVLGHGLEGIVSTDRAFDRITGLVRYDPAELIGRR
jgi:predicted nucleic acid-binding protein